MKFLSLFGKGKIGIFKKKKNLNKELLIAWIEEEYGLHKSVLV